MKLNETVVVWIAYCYSVLLYIKYNIKYHDSAFKKVFSYVKNLPM